jgi:hypothetical protein
MWRALWKVGRGSLRAWFANGDRRPPTRTAH